MTKSALDASVAISFIVLGSASPMPHANTVTSLSLMTSAEAMAAFCPPNLSLCSPSEKSSTILVALVAPGRVAVKSRPAASKPAEIVVPKLLSTCIWSIAALISTCSVDHSMRVVATDAKDTTEKRAASVPRA